jgi:outer membrane protein assembly factor BamE (lipoprotein component of BamABCDE complex)
MGTPTTIWNFGTSYTWHYGTSSVDFVNGKVVAWTQGLPVLKVTAGNAIKNAAPFGLNSTSGQVVAAMGTPTTIWNFGTSYTWHYGTSSVDFVNGKVVGWCRGDSALKVRNSAPVAGAAPVRVGSTTDQVAAALGTPQSVATFGFGSSWWYYGLSTIEIEGGVVEGWTNHGELTGKTGPQTVFKGIEETLSYASESQSATALSIPKTQTTAIWQLPRTERIQSTVKLTSGSSFPFVAENGSYYGQVSQLTGRPKTVFVHSYYRSDGTYVRSHYRSLPH